MPNDYSNKIRGDDKFFFVKILFQWWGSVYQLLYLEFFIFLLAYTLVTLVYRLALNDEQKNIFQGIIKNVEIIQRGTPLSFMLGFFVAAMMNRWWQLCLHIPLLSTPAFIIQNYVPGGLLMTHMEQDVDRDMRRCLLRYLNLAWILQMVTLSEQLQNRFTTFQLRERKSNFFSNKRSRFLDTKPSIRDKAEDLNNDAKVRQTFGELLMESEMKCFERLALFKLQEKSQSNVVNMPYWLPLQWASRLLQHSYEAGLMPSDGRYKILTDMLVDFRKELGLVGLYTSASTPLVYVQVVLIAVYSYFFAEIITSQAVVQDPTILDLYVPIASILKFLFYVGWFKVAIALMNPLGNDAQDFPLNDIFDSNLQFSIECGMAEKFLYPDDMTLADDCINSELNKKKKETEAAEGAKVQLRSVIQDTIRRCAGPIGYLPPLQQRSASFGALITRDGFDRRRLSRTSIVLRPAHSRTTIHGETKLQKCPILTWKNDGSDDLQVQKF